MVWRRIGDKPFSEPMVMAYMRREGLYSLKEHRILGIGIPITVKPVCNDHL